MNKRGVVGIIKTQHIEQKNYRETIQVQNKKKVGTELNKIKTYKKKWKSLLLNLDWKLVVFLTLHNLKLNS